MDLTAHHRQLEKLYHSANIQQFIEGSQLTVQHQTAEITLPVQPQYNHGANAMHGALYFKLLDDAAYFAVASIVQDVFIVTSSFQLNLVRPVTGGTIKAVGKVRTIGKNLFVAESTLFNEQGKEVAFGTGQFMKTNQPLSSLNGYAEVN
jgi:uncharacterized protein (TIGR00369 family)